MSYLSASSYIYRLLKIVGVFFTHPVYNIHCVPKNAPPSCDDDFVKSEPIFKIFTLLESLLNFQQNDV